MGGGNNKEGGGGAQHHEFLPASTLRSRGGIRGGGAEEREARTPLYWASREHGPHDMNTRTTLPNPNPPTPLTFCWATPHLLAVT